MKNDKTIAQLILTTHEAPRFVRFTRTGIVIPSDYPGDVDDTTEQRTLRGRILGIPTVTWKEHKFGRTGFAPWPTPGTKRYLMVRLATRRHGVLTLPLPPSAADELLRLEAELGSITDVDLVVSMVDRGNYFHATFAKVRRRAA